MKCSNSWQSVQKGNTIYNGLNSSYLPSTILGVKQDLAEKHAEDVISVERLMLLLEDFSNLYHMIIDTMQSNQIPKDVWVQPSYFKNLYGYEKNTNSQDILKEQEGKRICSKYSKVTVNT